MSRDNNRPILTVIGAGGIGSQAIDLLIPALRRVKQRCEIVIMDGDIVENTNLGHQKYTESDIGSPKVKCLEA